ncbi:hypothetical protein OH491_24470 [Termitidicoccus mucosus]|uniref:hypothetical protein n=1 Tax=Termitidicoccus mucosus TaxID=1184151 RepID=UPI0011AB7117
MKILVSPFVAIAFLLSGCVLFSPDQRELLAKLEPADRIQAIVGEHERIILDQGTILSICRWITTPERKWRFSTSFASLPASPQRAFFERDGKRIAYLAFGSNWLLINFYAPDSISISCSISESDYNTLSKLLGL